MSTSNYFQQLFSLSGKTALITGSCRGIGLAYARALASAGADIILVLHPSETEEAVDEIRSLGVKAYLFKVDLLDRDQINLSAAFILGQAFARDVIKRGAKGKLSTHLRWEDFSPAIIRSPTQLRNTVSNALTKSFSTEFAGKDINVNAITPGYTITELTRNNLEKNGQNFLRRIPISRFAETSDLEGAALFLASPASDYVSGKVLAVDGGESFRILSLKWLPLI